MTPNARLFYINYTLIILWKQNVITYQSGLLPYNEVLRTFVEEVTTFGSASPQSTS